MSSDRSDDEAPRLVRNSKITPYDAPLFTPVYVASIVLFLTLEYEREARAIRPGQMLINMQMMGDNLDLWLLR